FPPPPPLEPEPEPGGDPDPGGTNTMAVLGLVFAFLLPVLGVVFSAVGLAQTRRRGQAGRGLAVAGLVVSLVLVVAAAAVLAAFAEHARALGADFGRLVDAARDGGDPAALVTSIEQDGMALGQDCGRAGWLP